MDVLRYIGLPESQKERVQYYFSYITQFSHPTGEGLNFLAELPKALYEGLTGNMCYWNIGCNKNSTTLIIMHCSCHHASPDEHLFAPGANQVTCSGIT